MDIYNETSRTGRVSHSPQEWKWRLEERGILNNCNNNDKERARTASSLRRYCIQAFPDDDDDEEEEARIHSVPAVESGSSSLEFTATALDWLHLVTSRELPLVEAAVRSCRERWQQLQSRERILLAQTVSRRQRWRSHVALLGVCLEDDDGDDDDNNEMEAVSKWVGDKSQLWHDGRAQLQQVLDTHCESLREIVLYQNEVCTRLNQPEAKTVLSTDELLDRDCDPSMSNIARDWRALVVALEELLAFVRARHFEVKSMRSIPPFLSFIVASEDMKTLHRCEQRLEQVLEELKTPTSPLCVMGLLLGSPEATATCIESARKLHDEWKDTLQCHELVRKEAEACQAELDSLKEDEKLCRDRIVSLRLQVEQEIDKLLADGGGDRCFIELPL